ncbi:L-serine dehydratase [Granulicella aggregans]|uniref:L-serine ammonia-lyase n=1 Tax=Granulicella aggregans TaxID=474949 RepID=A0A7W7ZFR2_9BACT|nr:L-serine dehydratase [Granulicella aggregans]
MNTSLFELFKIGIGPSSSHTVGPMRAALRFVRELDGDGKLDRTVSVTVHLYGSLALTGIGHGTDRAILLGLLGEAPDMLDPATVEAKLTEIRDSHSLPLIGRHRVPFSESANLPFHRDQMYPTPGIPTHPNGMKFTACDASGSLISEAVFYSIGGGFIVTEAELAAPQQTSSRNVPYPFRSAQQLLALASEHNLSIADLLLANEVALLADPAVNINRPGSPSSSSSPEEKIKTSILELWRVMQECTSHGIATEGILPGGLNVRRRARRLTERLLSTGSKDPLAPIDWVTVWAMAVNEENAAGGRVVTAPTNGAAGVIPAIAHYYVHCVADLPDVALSKEETEAGLIRYFLTAAAIGILYKENASISGAEVGCQGEVGVACSMAAGGLVAALGGTNEQIEHAAEIAMEHNLGMTCDPIGGLVQIPCIERNGMGAVKAINASRMAMHETGGHKLSLDQVIATMYQTGLDMQSRYKETSLAGLALNIIEC